MESPKQDFSLTVNAVDEDEKLLAVVTRHPFGIIKLYAQVLAGLGLAGGLVIVLLPDLLPREANPEVYIVVGILALVLMGFMALLLFIATILYFKSKLVITDGSLTQTIQDGLFTRKVSQLALSSVEDVTALKSGFFPTILNYGRLVVETAGEQANFHFDYCARADHYAKLILEARQGFLSKRELEMRQEGQTFIANNHFQQPQYNMNAQQYRQGANTPTQVNTDVPQQNPPASSPSPSSPTPDQNQTTV
jgi:hypothetical protein